MMRRRNIIAGLVLVAAGLGYGLLTLRLPTRTLPYTPDPSFFPWINTGLILVLAAALLVRAVLSPRVADKPDGTAARGRERAAALTLGAFLAYLLALPVVGFLLATIPFFAVLMLLLGERRPIWVITGSVAVPLMLFVVFRLGFGIILPRGLMSAVLG